MTYDDLKREWLDSAGFLKARTSGSTGKPQEIALPKRMVHDSALRTINYFHLGADSRLHSCISPDFIGGKMMLIRSLCCGGAFSFEEPSNRPLQGIGREETLDLVAVVPSQMRYIVDHLEAMPIVRNYLIGGSSISPDLTRAIASAGLNAFESYGMTETSSHIALRRVSTDDFPFTPLPGIGVSIDGRGCLIIDLGEYGRITTNDIASIDGKGNFRIHGRIDHVIVTGGKKVHPQEVERKISPLFLGHDICITSRPDPLWTKRVVLLVEGRELPDTPENLNSKMKSILTAHSVPKEVILVPELERTPSGKIIRRPLT